MLGLERQKQLLGCSEDSCLAEMAGGLGVDYVLVGSLGKIGAVLQLNMKIIDSKKSRVLLRKGVTVSGAEEKLVEVVQKLTREMVAGIPSRDAPALKATVTPAMAVPVPEPVAGVVSPPPADSPAAPMTRRSWSYLFGGAGLAAVGTGAIFGGLSLSAYHQEQDAAKAHDRAAYDAARSSSALRSNVADVLYLAGAAGLGVGAYLFFTGEPAATVTLAPIRGGASAVFTLELP